MKKVILVVLISLLFVGCISSKTKVNAAYEKYQQDTDWETWETIVANKHEEVETLLFENIEIETYETNTNYWD